jgi:hypothetical protein
MALNFQHLELRGGIACLALTVLAVNGVSQEQGNDDVEESSLPLPELQFGLEEDGLEYLVEKPAGYLRLPSWSEKNQRTASQARAAKTSGLWPGQKLASLIKVWRPLASLAHLSGPRIPEDSRVILSNVERKSEEQIPEAYLPYYFGERPKRFIGDVQCLLTDSAWRDIDWYLTYHSNESDYGFYVLLFSSGEKIPEGISGDALLSKWFPEGNGVLAFYFHGRPELVELFFPNKLGDEFSKADFQQNLTEAIDSASQHEEPGKQLDEFCQKVGTWLLWWEKRLDVKGRNGSEGPEVAAPVRIAATSSREGADLEIAAGSTSESGLGSLLWGVIASIGLLLIGLALWAFKEMFGGKSSSVVHFPERMLDSRLGAPHSGGGSAVLTFGSKS